MERRNDNETAEGTERKPSWIKVRLPNGREFWDVKQLVEGKNLFTVCEEAHCPNRYECWNQGTATFMIAGERCTRACGFCATRTAKKGYPEHYRKPERAGGNRIPVFPPAGTGAGGLRPGGRHF